MIVLFISCAVIKISEKEVKNWVRETGRQKGERYGEEAMESTGQRKRRKNRGIRWGLRA